MYFSSCGLILSSTIVESVFRMVFSSVIGRRFFGGPFGFPGFGNGMNYDFARVDVKDFMFFEGLVNNVCNIAVDRLWSIF